MDDSHIYTGKFPQSFARTTLEIPNIKIEEMEYSFLEDSYGPPGSHFPVLPPSTGFAYPDPRCMAVTSHPDTEPEPAQNSPMPQRTDDSENASRVSFLDPSNTVEGEHPVVNLKNGTTYRIIKFGPLFYTTPPQPQTCSTGHTQPLRFQDKGCSDPSVSVSSEAITLVHVGFQKSSRDSQTLEKATMIEVRETHTCSSSGIASSATRRSLRLAKSYASLSS